MENARGSPPRGTAAVYSISQAPQRKQRRAPMPGTVAGIPFVGLAGFEPATSCSQSRRATKLRYSPMRERAAHLNHDTQPNTRPLSTTSPHHPQIQPYPPVPATASAEPQTTTHKYGPISRSPYRAVCRTRQITSHMAQHEATGRPNRCSCNPPKTGAPRYTPIRDPPQATDRTLPKIPTQHRTAVSNRPSSPADTNASVRSCDPPNTPLPRCAPQPRLPAAHVSANNAKGRGTHTNSAANSICPDYSRLPIGPAHGLVSSGSRADWIGTSGQCLAGSVFGLNGNFSARIFS